MFFTAAGRHTRFDFIFMGICIIVCMVWYVWETRRAFRYKNMKMRMTKRINVVIAERRESNRGYSGGPFYRYGYIFSGLEEYQGVIFDDRSLRVKKKYEKGEIVSLLINEYNTGEFWFEEADDPWKRVPILWIIMFLWILVYAHWILRDWTSYPWF